MLTLQTSISGGHRHHDDHGGNIDHEQQLRDIHPLTPPRAARIRRPTSSPSTFSHGDPSENFTTISRELSTLAFAGSTVENNDASSINIDNYSTTTARNPLSLIGEEDLADEMNPLAIVLDTDSNPLGSGPHRGRLELAVADGEISLQGVKKEEVESKIGAWQNGKISKINNRFRREEAVINGRESEQIQTANSWMKKVERKLEDKRVGAVEKMENEMAKARRKAEERRASAEAKRGTKVAKVVDMANLMRAIGIPPTKRSFF